MKVYIKPNSSFFNPVRYVLKIIEKNRCVKFELSDIIETADLIWDTDDDRSENIALSFYEELSKSSPQLRGGNSLNENLEVNDGAGRVDIIATIFYMINCFQEINPVESDLDEFGRFRYASSYQSKKGVIDENLVEKLIDRFCEEHSIIGTKKPSTFFISHDIDTIYGSFLQDGFWALKKMNIGVVLKLILWEISRRPHWKNIDQIIKLNSEYDIRSTFFWLVNKGQGLQGIKNADYKIDSEQALLKLVSESNNINGLHKSSSDMTINDELKKGKIQTRYNRYHFLNFQTHRDWNKISDSELNFDCSLGFAEHYGFRNSYGKAFQPFNISRNELHDFVEAPLNFMDTTFQSYLKSLTDSVGDTIIKMYEKNPLNCDFSLLWHNNFFTNYKYNSYLEEYKRIAAFIYENKIECLAPNDLIKRNRLEW